MAANTWWDIFPPSFKARRPQRAPPGPADSEAVYGQQPLHANEICTAMNPKWPLSCGLLLTSEVGHSLRCRSLPPPPPGTFLILQPTAVWSNPPYLPLLCLVATKPVSPFLLCPSHRRMPHRREENRMPSFISHWGKLQRHIQCREEEKNDELKRNQIKYL